MGKFPPGLGIFGIGIFGIFGTFGGFGAEPGNFGLLGDEPPVPDTDLGANGFDDDPGERVSYQPECLLTDTGIAKDDAGDLCADGRIQSSQLPDLPGLEDPDEPREESEDPEDEPPPPPPPPPPAPPAPPPPLLLCRKPRKL